MYHAEATYSTRQNFGTRMDDPIYYSGTPYSFVTKFGKNSAISKLIVSGKAVTYHCIDDDGVTEVSFIHFGGNYTFYESSDPNYNNIYTVDAEGNMIVIGKGVALTIDYPFGGSSYNFFPYGFDDGTQITTLEIREGVIGVNQAPHAHYLRKVILPQSLESINEKAFYDCIALTELVIPDGVNYINESTFEGCVSLERVILPAELKSIDKSAFASCSSLKEIVIPDKVTTIGKSAFNNCSSLISCTIPNSVTTIAADAFEGCDSMTDIYFKGTAAQWINVNYEPNSNVVVHTTEETGTHIDIIKFGVLNNGMTWTIDTNSMMRVEGTGEVPSSAFQNRNDFVSLYIASDITSIGENAFQNCNYLEAVRFDSDLIKIGNRAFYHCLNLTDINFPEGLSEIGNEAFSGCENINQIHLPESLISVGSYAFSGCCGITTIRIPQSLTELSRGMFSGCTGLMRIDLPKTLMWIGANAFLGCSGLSEFNIPESVTEIEGSAFSGCSKLKKIVIPESVTAIRESTFSGCSGLIEIVISKSVTSIEESAFIGCSGLSVISIPKNVAEIKRETFSGCTGLKEIVIPESVTSIGESAFSGCSGLTEIVIPKSVTSIEKSAFSGCTGLTEIVIPGSVKAIGEYAFSDCTGMLSLSLPELKAVDNTWINGCSSLNKIQYGGSYLEWAAAIDFDHYDSENNTYYENEDAIDRQIQSNHITISCAKKSQGSCGNDLNWEYDEKTCTLSFIGSGVMNDYQVYPEQYITQSWSGYVYTANRYRSSAPWGKINDEIKTIVFSDHQENIGKAAFYGAVSLQSLYIPEGVRGVSDTAFQKCSKLEEVTIPTSMESISTTAFSDCNSLRSIVYEGNYIEWRALNYTFTASGDQDKVEVIYKKESRGLCGDNLSWYYNIEAQALTITGTGAMNNYSDSSRAPWYPVRDELMSVTFNNGAASIGSYAFLDCSLLEEVSLPESLKEIGASAFDGCSGLKKVNYIGNRSSLVVGENNSPLTSAKWPWEQISSGPCGPNLRWTYYESSTETNLNGTRHLIINKAKIVISGNGEMYNYSADNQAPWKKYFDSDYRKPYYDEVYTASELEVILEPGVTSVGNHAFAGIPVSKKMEVSICDTITSIGDYAFCVNSGLKEVTIPESVREIGDYSFQFSIDLGSITVLNGNASIGLGAFGNCDSSLVVYGWPASTTESYCQSHGHTFKALVEPDFFLPSMLTAIESESFSNIKAAAVVIPKSVITVVGNPFEGSNVQFIFGYSDSSAEAFASNYGYIFVPITDTWMAMHK